MCDATNFRVGRIVGLRCALRLPPLRALRVSIPIAAIERDENWQIHDLTLFLLRLYFTTHRTFEKAGCAEPRCDDFKEGLSKFQGDTSFSLRKGRPGPQISESEEHVSFSGSRVSSSGKHVCSGGNCVSFTGNMFPLPETTLPLPGQQGAATLVRPRPLAEAVFPLAESMFPLAETCFLYRKPRFLYRGCRGPRPWCVRGRGRRIKNLSESFLS